MKRWLEGTIGIMGILFVHLNFAQAAWVQTGPIGWGSPAVGRGGAGVAVADTCAVLTVNPAGMTQIEGNRLDMGGGLLIPRMRFSNPYTNSTHEVHYYPFPEVGYVYKLKDSPWSFGVGLYANSGGGWDYPNLKNQFFPGGKQSTALLQVAKAIGAAAYQVNEKLSVGFAVDGYHTTLNIKSTLGPGIYLNTEEPAKGEGSGFAIGLLYKLHSKLTLGLNYTSHSWMGDLKTSDTQVTFSPLSPWGSKFSKAYHFKLRDFGEPQKISFGFAYRPTERILFALDMNWKNFSSQWKKWGVSLINDKPVVKAIYPFDYRDDYDIQFGVDYTLKCGLTLRAGYSWSTDILKDQALFWVPIIHDVHNIGVGMGYGWKQLEINWAWSKCLTMKEYCEKTVLPQPDFNKSHLSYGDQYFSLMLTWHFR
jgi:long-subunit fatty acid transport protein